MIRARVVAHSLNIATGDELLTMEWTYPRMVHAEALRHRSLSRNAASSRAIPVKKMLGAIQDEPAHPVEWGTAKAGMVAGDPVAEAEGQRAMETWLHARNEAMTHAWTLLNQGLHKQVINRLVEPFAQITELVSGTEWGNFYRLRISPYADPTLRALATAAARAHLASTPRPCQPGDWHIPFGDQMPEGLTEEERIKVATARCARISYLNHDGVRFSVDDDIRKHDELRHNSHWSPFEHCARAMEAPEAGLVDRMESAGWSREVGDAFYESFLHSRNFRGWQQYRAMVDIESQGGCNLFALAALVDEHGYPPATDHPLGGWHRCRHRAEAPPTGGASTPAPTTRAG